MWRWGLHGHPGTGTHPSTSAGTVQPGPAGPGRARQDPGIGGRIPLGKQGVLPARPAGAGDGPTAAPPLTPRASKATVPAPSGSTACRMVHLLLPGNSRPAGSRVGASSASRRWCVCARFVKANELQRWRRQKHPRKVGGKDAAPAHGVFFRERPLESQTQTDKINKINSCNFNNHCVGFGRCYSS